MIPSVPPLLPRFTSMRIEDERRLARILLEAGDAIEGTDLTVPVRSANGWNRQRARGIPIVGRIGGAGASPGTDPLGALLGKEARRR